ncbi:MAG: hypothetical protein K2I48_05565 [Muribaculaceae bacterium]|nr:hypothetical protein [Muribaculaceae bacterium]
MKRNTIPAAAIMLAAASSASAADNIVVATDAYRWQGDTIFQNEFKAWAESPEEIRSTYKGRPGFFMPVEQTWHRKNDLSAYPKLKTPNLLHSAIYNLALDEMVNAVEPDTTLRTGKEWAGVWTRDVSYSIILSMAALQPEAAMHSLLKKINAEGQIIQDTGSGGAWPVSTDRMIWAVAAWEVYKTTGDKEWLRKVYPVVERSLAKDAKTIFSADGLVKGETSFIDWREQSYPKWMQTVDISQSEAMGTNVLYAAALKCASEMAAELGKKKEAATFAKESADLAQAIEKRFALPDKGYWGMYTYGLDDKIVNPRMETLGQSLAILYDIASPERQRQMSESSPITPFGPPVFYPQISDMPSYHNNALWPFVAAYWGLAQAKAGNEAGVMEAIGSVFRPAALFTTNKENLNLDNGDFFTELNSSNMLWCLSGNLALTNRILFGINYEKDGLLIRPFVPEAMAATRTLADYPYRNDGRLSITVEGYGANVAELLLDGKPLDPAKVIPAKRLSGNHEIIVKMDNQPIPEMVLNRLPNVKAPLTPIARLVSLTDAAGNPSATMLEWQPIEYIGEYAVLCDGQEVARTHSTTYPVDGRSGVWQIIGYSGQGVPSFASAPVSNRPAYTFQPGTPATTLQSAEVSYPSRGPITGYTGEGFVETDKTGAPVEISIEAPEAGEYALYAIYANGNGPVNTENKCAIRSVEIDGQDVGTMVLPTRGVGNWSDWGRTNALVVTLPAGSHTLTLRYNPEDSNMNLSTNHAIVDRVVVEKRN